MTLMVFSAQKPAGTGSKQQNCREHLLAWRAFYVGNLFWMIPYTHIRPWRSNPVVKAPYCML